MIIGINGRIGHGKDTVGRIIQYLTSEYRDKYDFVEWRDRVENYGSNTYSPFEIKKYAGKLKTIASLLTGVPAEKFEDQEFKKQKMPKGWGMTYRTFLQRLGTEAMRDGLHTNVWVNALFSDYVSVVKEWDEFGNDTVVEYPNWIITDMRFPNEMEAVKERGGISIRVNRQTYKNPKEVTVEYIETINHSSETALDSETFDYTIDNNNTIEELIEKVKEILTKSGVI